MPNCVSYTVVRSTVTSGVVAYFVPVVDIQTQAEIAHPVFLFFLPLDSFEWRFGDHSFTTQGFSVVLSITSMFLQVGVARPIPNWFYPSLRVVANQD